MRPIHRTLLVARRLIAPLLAIILLSTINTASAALVQGHLLYNNGIPAPDIAVRLCNATGVPLTPFTYSVRGGKFYLKNVAPGTYTLEIWRNRALVISRPVTVTEPGFDLKDVRLP